MHILSEFDTIKRGPQETVLEYCTSFNAVYNSIPQNLRPPLDLALIKFPDTFDADMAYQLRERAPVTLADMQNIAVSVEANLIAKRNRARAERRTTFKDEPSSFEQKLDAIIKGMDRLGDRVETIERKSSWEGQTTNAKNQNFRKNQNPTAGRTDTDHHVRPPFQENYAEASTSSEPCEDPHINLIGLDGQSQVFLTQEDHNDEDNKQSYIKSGESFDFKQGYDTAVYEVHKQYKLRSKTINVTQPEKPKEILQPKKVIISEPSDKADPIPNKVTVEEITQEAPSNKKSMDKSPLDTDPNNSSQKKA